MLWIGIEVFKQKFLKKIQIIIERVCKQMLEYWDNNMNVIFRRQKDIRVADAVLHIFRIKGSIELFNKKALYILIREMTQSNTQHITRVINVMKKYQKGIYKEFQVNGFIDTKTTGSFVIITINIDNY